MNIKGQCLSALDTPTERLHYNNTSLPHVKLPVFSGLYDEFPKFHDIFLTAVVNNKTLTNIERYMHLLAHLKGEPYNLVSTLSVSGDNFQRVWELLIKKYSNKAKILDTHIKALLNLPQVKSNASSLKPFISQIAMNWSGLKSVSLDIDLGEVILQHLVLSKLDLKTRESWYLAHSSAKKMTGLQELLDFLNQRVNALEFNEDISQRPQSNFVTVGKPHQPSSSQKVFSIKVSDAMQCILCPESHPLYKCAQFQQLSVSDRSKVCRQHSLCINCLFKAGAGHPAAKNVVESVVRNTIPCCMTKILTKIKIFLLIG